MGRDPSTPSTSARDVTRITGTLPTIDAEIIYHEAVPKGQGRQEEIITITLRAHPGFEAWARFLFPALTAFDAGSLTPGQRALGTFPPFGCGPGGGNAPAAMLPVFPISGFGPWADPLSFSEQSLTNAHPWSSVMEQTWAPWMSMWQQGVSMWSAVLGQIVPMTGQGDQSS